MAIVVDFTKGVGVYPFDELAQHGPANDVIAGVPIAVVLDPLARDRWRVFHRVVEERTLTLAVSEGRLMDAETGTTWDPVSGRALEGPLLGEILDILPGFTSFESDARTFWPDASSWRG